MDHPAIPTLLACILSLYPLMKIFARVGLPRVFALLVFASMVIPFSGYLLTALMLTRPWPKFPKVEPKPKPVKLEIV